MENKNAI